MSDQQANRGSQTVLRLVEANRASFDSPQSSPGAAERRVAALEAALMASRAEAALLHAMQASTSWRLTAPLRWAAARLQPRAITPPPQPAPLKRWAYDDWIEQCEPACLAELATAPPGGQAVAAQSLGIVVLPGAGAAEALARLLATCPACCRILALDAGDPTELQDFGCQDFGRQDFGRQDSERHAMACSQLRVQAVPAGFQPDDALSLAHNLADLLCVLDPRDRLAPAALPLVAAFAARHPQADIIFADEDWLVDGRRAMPFFKPGWDGELQRGRDLLGPFTFFRSALLQGAVAQPGPAWLYDLASQAAAAARPERIVHIPAVLCHRAAPPPPPAAMRAAAAAHLQRAGAAAEVVAGRDAAHRVVYHLPTPHPSVSVIVPTRDRAELLATCTDALLRRTDYERLELLVVDNGSVQPEALAVLDRLASDRRTRVLRHPGPFNWSVLNNRAAREATGDVLVLLNNDIDVLHPNWLSVLVSHAIQPGVGAAGAKLLYPDGRVQHAGLTTDIAGVPRHLFRFAPGDSAGPFGLMGAARQVWAVTGACLAIARDVFTAVGGLNEALPVGYNDVEFCLRLTAHGYRIIWTPWAVLEHRELATRTPDHLPERREQADEELKRLVRDWGRLAQHDPFLSCNFHLEEEEAPQLGRARVPSLLA